MSLRAANIEVSLQRLSILRIEHPQANPLKLACTLRTGEALPSGLTITAEIHASRNVAAETAPLAASTITVAADATTFDVSFSSAQLNQTVTPDSTRALWLVVYGVGDADQLYTLAAADLLLGWHAISALTPAPPAAAVLVEKGGVAWVSGQQYVSGTVVTVGATAYVATADHTSATADQPGIGVEWATFWVLLSGGGTTNLSAVPSPTNVVVTSDTGTDATIPAADGTNAGLMLPAQVTKLAGVATEATANATDAQLRDRSTHTGQQAISTIVNLQTSLDGKADLVGGKLNTSQLPDLAISQYLGTAANQSAMLLLVGQRGDWCTRTDDGKVYVVTGEPSSTLGNWTSLSYPTAPVLSVAGRTGAITLSSSDILGLGTLATQSGTFSGTSSGTNTGNVTLAASVSSVLTLSGQQLQAVTDPPADRIVFFDQSSVSMAYATIGNGLLMTGTDLAVSLTSPGPIGGTTPGEGTFNQLNARTSLEVQATTGAGGPLRVWNTGTDTPTNWERARLQWSSNVFIIGTEANGTGVARAMDFQTGGTTRIRFGTTGSVVIPYSDTSTELRIHGTGGFTAGDRSVRMYMGNSTAGFVDSVNEGGYGVLSLRANGTTMITINSQGSGTTTFRDPSNFVFGTTTGTRIGTATNQRMGFWNATPAVQPTAVADATDAASVITQLNALLARLRTIGIIAT